MSAQINRLTVSRGPALVVFAGGSFLSRESIVVELSKDTAEIPSDAFGKLTDVNLGIKAACKFRPVGEFEHLSVLWPYAATVPGTSIFGGADAPLVIKPLDTAQDMVTFHAAGVSQMPNLTFTAKDTLIGEVGFQMVGANNVAADDPNRLFTFATNDLGAVPYDPAGLLIQAYEQRWLSAGTFTLSFGGDTTSALDYDATANEVQTALNALPSIVAINDVTVTGSLEDGWTITFDSADGNVGAVTGAVAGMPGGSALGISVETPGSTGVSEVVAVRLEPWARFNARDGATVNFDVQLTEDETDAIGHYDTIFSGLAVTVQAQPQGITQETVLAAARIQGAGAVRGTKFSSGAHDYRITGDGVHFLAYAAQLDGAGLNFSSKDQRIPQLTWRASRSVGAGGALNPLFYIGTAAPV